MRIILLSVLITFLSELVLGQGIWNIDFEDSIHLHRVHIDHISDTNNIWQIGHPSKTFLNSAHSVPNVIITDTIKPYPINDTSSFTVSHIADLRWSSPLGNPEIGGYYYVNSDTMADFGYLDLSTDLGKTWLRADSLIGTCTIGGMNTEAPVLTGNSNGWRHFYYCLTVPQPVNFGDTILYRFTFISDSIQTNKEGLMFDDLHFEDWIEGIPELRDDNLMTIFPNPTSDNLKIQMKEVTDNMEVQIFDYLGKLKIEIPFNQGEEIQTSQLSNGIYKIKCSSANMVAIKTFVVQH